MSGRQLDRQLLEELECLFCTEYTSSPISMCENGHNICGGCKERITECPTCRGTFIKGRNIVLEKLAAATVYTCITRRLDVKRRSHWKTGTIT